MDKWKGLDRKGGYWKGLELQKIVCAGKVVWEKAAKLPNILQGADFYFNFEDGGKDISGNNNNATILGNPTIVDWSKGKALKLNGSSQYAVLGNFECTDSFTMGCWVFIEQNKNIIGFIGKSVAYSTNNRFSIFSESSNLYINAATTATTTTTTTITGKWVHLVMTYDAFSGIAQLYVDGQKTSELTANPKISAGKTNFYIGAYGDFTGQNIYGDSYLAGMISKVFFIRKVLTQSEITQLHNE